MFISFETFTSGEVIFKFAWNKNCIFHLFNVKWFLIYNINQNVKT